MRRRLSACRVVKPVTVAALLSVLAVGAAQAQSGLVAIRAGRILTASGPAIVDGVILLRNGKIIALGKDVKIPADAKVMDARTRTVIPGLIAANSSLAERSDPEETVTPEVRAADGYDYYSDSRRWLESGLTTAYLSTGARRLVSGQGAVVKLAGDGPAARNLRASADVRVMLGAYAKNPPALFRPPLPPTDDSPLLPAQRQLPSVRPAEFALLRQLFAEARRTANGAKPGLSPVSANVAPIPADRNPLPTAHDPRLRALGPVLNGSLPLRVTANTAPDIRRALEFADQFRLKLILEGGTEAYQLAAELAKRHIPVVVTSPLRPGHRIGEDYQRPGVNGKTSLRNVATLLKAGVPVALAPSDDSDLTDLLLLAAAQVPYGVAPDAALRLVTLNAADALGVRGRVGSLEVGKDADLVILSGDPLRSYTRVESTLVNGKVVYDRAAPLSGKLTAIRAGRILTVGQGEITNGVILLRDGKIVAVQREAAIPADAQIIDASHSVVMPGMIDAHSYLGLHADAEPVPTDPVAAQTGPASGRTHLLNALAPNDPAFAAALREGVTAVLLAPPTASPTSGQAVLLKTLNDPAHLLTNKGRIVREVAALCFNMQGGTPRMAQIGNFRDLLTAAKGYTQRRAQYERDFKEWERDRDDAKLRNKDLPKEPAETPKDDDMEPFAALFRGDIPAFIHVGRADEIMNALKLFRDEFDVPVTLVDAPDSFRVVEEIRKRDASVALGPEVTLRDKGKLVNSADLLARAGVRVLFQTSSSSGTQFLRLNAASAVHNGLDPTEALRALTLNPARVLHVDDRLGSIEAGKDADLVILNGDPLDLTSRVEKVFVNGKVVYDAK